MDIPAFRQPEDVLGIVRAATLAIITTSCSKAVFPDSAPQVVNIEGECPVVADFDSSALRLARAASPIEVNLGDMVVEVLEVNDSPVADVEITMRWDTTKTEPGLRSLTDHRGTAEWRNLPPGSYWLKAKALGYLTVRGEVRVRANRRDTLQLRLRHSPLGCAPIERW